MRIAMAQISTTGTIEQNIEKTIQTIRKASDADLLLFPEAQLTSFFPQYRESEVQCALGMTKEELAVSVQEERIQEIFRTVGEAHVWCSPNFYVKENGKYYDMSFAVDPQGTVVERAKMVHVVNAPQFYELDYYTPSEEGFRVFDTPFGRIGIVICFDRHLPESIRTCALKGAQLILIPTVNTKAEPLEMFAWELRVQAYQNNVFIAMCNKTGKEGDMDFAGQSIVVDSDGNIVVIADDQEQIVYADVDLSQCAASRRNRPYITLRRPEFYEDSSV